MPRKPSSLNLSLRFFLAAALFTAAALTGCSAGSLPVASNAAFPNVLHLSESPDEPVSTLGANYAFPPDPRHRTRLRNVPSYVSDAERTQNLRPSL